MRRLSSAWGTATSRSPLAASMRMRSPSLITAIAPPAAAAKAAPASAARPAQAAAKPAPQAQQRPAAARPGPSAAPAPVVSSRDQRKQFEAELRRHKRAVDVMRQKIAELEAQIARHEHDIKSVEAEMSAPGFYDDHATSKPVIDRHQQMMWTVGDLMNRWEMLQQEMDTLQQQAPTPST